MRPERRRAAPPGRPAPAVGRRRGAQATQGAAGPCSRRCAHVERAWCCLEPQRTSFCYPTPSAHEKRGMLEGCCSVGALGGRSSKRSRPPDECTPACELHPELVALPVHPDLHTCTIGRPTSSPAAQRPAIETPASFAAPQPHLPRPEARANRAGSAGTLQGAPDAPAVRTRPLRVPGDRRRQNRWRLLGFAVSCCGSLQPWATRSSTWRSTSTVSAVVGVEGEERRGTTDDASPNSLRSLLS